MFEMVEEYDVQKVRKEERMAGKIEGRLEIAENMLKMGLTIEQICEATKLDKEKIKEIKRKTYHLIDFEYILFDVNRYSQKELLKTANVISSIFLLDQEKEKEGVIEKLRKLADILKTMSNDEYRYIKKWLNNLSDSGLTEEEQENLKKIIEKSNPQEVEEMINNYARSVGEYKEEGIEIGIEIGKEQGRKEGIGIGMEKGIEKGIEKIVRSMLKNGAKVEDIIKITDLNRAEVEKIKENIKSASS